MKTSSQMHVTLCSSYLYPQLIQAFRHNEFKFLNFIQCYVHTWNLRLFYDKNPYADKSVYTLVFCSATFVTSCFNSRS